MGFLFCFVLFCFCFLISPISFEVMIVLRFVLFCFVWCCVLFHSIFLIPAISFEVVWCCVLFHSIFLIPTISFEVMIVLHHLMILRTPAAVVACLLINILVYLRDRSAQTSSCADQTFHLTQSHYTDTGPTSPTVDPITLTGRATTAVPIFTPLV